MYNVLRVFLLLLAGGAAYGGLVFPQSPADLGRQADLIVIGSAGAVLQQASTATFPLLISRVLKGNADLSGTTVSVWWQPPQPLPESDGSVPQSGTSGMWFLQQRLNGWTLLPVAQGAAGLSMAFYPVPSGPIQEAYAYAADVPVSDKVAAELGAALEATTGSAPQLWALHFALLDDLASPYVSLLYSRLSTSQSAQQRILGLSGQIRLGSSPALQTAYNFAAPFATYGTENGVLLFSLRNYFRSRDTASVAVLGGVVADQSAPSGFREAAAHALAAVHVQAALPFLATLLSDTDAQLRIEAIGGIGSFANGLPPQTPSNTTSLAYLQFPQSAPFMSDDTKAHFAIGATAIERNESWYVSYWSQWWSEHRSALVF
jgi:hypothetical protein